MKKFSKRFVAIVLCVVLLIGVMPVTSSAADDAVALSFVFTKEKDTTSELDYAKINDIIYVGIKADNLPSISGFVFSIHYDAQVLDLQEEYSYSIEIPGIGSVPVFTDGLYQSGSFARPTPDYVVDEVTHIGTASYAWASSSTSGTANNENGVMFYIPFKVIGTGLTNLEFNTEHDNWQITIPGDQRAETIVSNGSLLSVTTGVNLTTTDVTVDGSNGATIDAMAFNNDVEEITSGVVWEVSGEENSGVSIDQNGTITIDAKAKAGEYTVTAAGGDGTFGGSNTASATFTVSRATPVAESLSITPETASNVIVPEDGTEAASTAFTATVTDQFGDPMSADVEWSVAAQDETVLTGITIENGTLKVGNEAKSIITDATGKVLTVTAKYGNLSDTATITVKRAAPVATSVAIYKDETAISSDTIAIPQSGSSEATYTAKVLDQYGSEMEGEVTWSTEGTVPSKVDVSDGTVTVSAGASTGNFSLKATSDSVSGSVSISVASISFGDDEAIKNALTISDTPTYGMTWGDIVKVTGEISANVGGTPVEGTYSVKDADTTPDAGENEEYTILFTSTDGTYNNITVYTGNVIIAPKAVAVTGITVNDKQYDGNNTATVNYTGEGVSVSGTIGGDVVTVTSATGTFADANVGTDKALTVEIELSNSNYVVEDLKLMADITAKELTADVTNVDVSKVYDGTTAPGTVTGSASVTGTVGSEAVTVNVTAGNYTAKDVKSDYTVELTLELTGDAAKNYVLSSTTATISDAAITACSDFADATNKTQNVVVGVGTFTAPSFTGVTVNGTPEAVDGEVTYSYSNGETSITKGSYDDIVTALKALKKDASAEINYKFTASGNYTGEITGTISVTMVDILFTVDGETANAKNALDIDTNAVYGETWADIVTIKSGINATLNERPVEGTYQLSVNTTDRPTAGNHSFELQFVSGGKIYKVCDATVNVAKREVSISGGLSVTSKQYDGTANATVTGTAALSNVFGTDNVGLTYTGGTFESKNAGTHNVTLIDATLIGDDKDNYTLSNNYTLTGTIDKRPVTVTDGLSVTGKEYDGTTRADIVNSATFDNVVTGESLTLTFTGANFASADVGTHDVTLTGVALGGDYAANYELTGNLPALSGTISKATYSPAPSLNINIVTNQAAAQTGTLTALNFFGGSTPADATITAVGPAKGTVISGISVANGTLTYTSAANITAEGTTETYKVTISTRNYNDITATLTFTTVAKTPVTISDVSVADKVYNGQAVSYIGTPTAAANGETVEVSAYTYTWQNAEGNVLSAAPVNAGSYKLVIAVAADDPNYVGSATVSFTISKATVTVTVDDKEAYVGSDMPELTYTVSGLASGESLAVNPTLTCNADMDKPGEYAITASGAAVPATGNYNETITYVPGTLTVSRRPINVGPTYDIDVVDSDNGSVKASLGNASEGSVITLTVTPDDGYKLGSITVIDENGDEVEVRRSGSEYKFTMPDSDVRVSARFVRDTGALPFNDVNAGDWFYDYVEYVYNNGIMDGVDNGVFSPNTETTRGMVVTILYRLAGEPNVRGGNDFSDVASGAYYADAVTWASNAGIVNGTSATTFSPNALVTREQFAAMLYRYMSYIGEDVSASTNLNRYTDAGSVSAYAETAMSWAVAEGIINGRTATTLAPAGNCTRAEVAAMITRVFG